MSKSLVRRLVADKGFSGKAFAAQLAAWGTAVLVPPSKNQRAAATIAAHTLQLTCPCQHLTEPT